MKFIIARTTVETTFAAVNEVERLHGERSSVLPSNATLNAQDDKANVSIRAVDENIVVEINDEVLTKYLALYVKTARLVAPVVTAVFTMFGAVQALIKSDVDDLVKFIKQPKAK